jgi:hypothetical protein
MKFYTATLAATSALCLSMSMAHAGNTAYTDQSGSLNTASVDQTAGEKALADVDQNGDSNTATVTQGGNTAAQGLNITRFTQDGGSNSATVSQDGQANQAGTGIYPSYNDIHQGGDNNTLDISQTGYGNQVAGSGLNEGHVYQSGDQNDATVTQNGRGNLVSRIYQNDNSGGTATDPTNVLTINQSGATYLQYEHSTPSLGPSTNYNYSPNSVVSVTQTNPGGTVNTLTLTQTGSTFHQANQIMRVEQNGTDNAGSVTQDGRRNFLLSLDQLGDGNAATVGLHGYGNGDPSTGLTSTSVTAAAFDVGSHAAVVGLGQATVYQNGTGNTATYSATGNSNRYALSQTDDSNGINGVVSGDNNQAAVSQWGGSSNTADFLQYGNSNDLGIAQDGGSNIATVNVMGNSNALGSDQVGNGNMLTATFTGNSNGVGTFGAGGVAGILEASSTDLTQGNVLQNSTGASLGNDITYDVTGNSNLFAFAQIGGDNSITGTVGSNSNQVAVLQTGTGNDTVFTQTGGNNNAIAVSQ